ncbi:15-hydroxyprostaglandin dehydrogenase [Trichonephila clavipes]|nr:15-hydroxyprostaglandin dehydrogenase [Trichonephila clavipes]
MVPTMDSYPVSSSPSTTQDLLCPWDEWWDILTLAWCGNLVSGVTGLVVPRIHSDTMTSAVLADPTRALQGTNRGSWPAMEESENDVGSLEQLLLYADEHYLAGKLPLGDHLGKVLMGSKNIINVTLAR